MAKSRRAQETAAERARIFSILHKWGIHTVGHFGRLNKTDVAARLGPEAIGMWERARGKSRRVLNLVTPPESFEESFEFDHEIETIEPLLFILRRFLGQIASRLDAIYLVAGELTLRLTFSNRRYYERLFKIPQPTSEIELLYRMLHTHLENFQSEHPITAVSITAAPARPAAQQFGLFEAALRNPAQLSETMARLVALLGQDRVGTPVVEETHRPDAFHVVPFQWQVGAVDPNRREFDVATQPTLRRFRPPPPAAVLLDLDLPVHLRGHELNGETTATAGPYHASGNWWDEQAWTRREWDLQLSSGAIVRAHEQQNRWQLDGVYD
jgi:protein ImuB